MAAGVEITADARLWDTAGDKWSRAGVVITADAALWDAADARRMALAAASAAALGRPPTVALSSDRDSSWVDLGRNGRVDALSMLKDSS